MKRKIELVDEEDESERCADESEDEEPTIKDVLSNLFRWLKSVFLICCIAWLLKMFYSGLPADSNFEINA